MRPDADFVPVPNDAKLVVQWFTDGRLSMLPPRDIRLYQGNTAPRPPKDCTSTYATHITAAMAAADAWLECVGNRKEQVQQKNRKTPQLEEMQQKNRKALQLNVPHSRCEDPTLVRLRKTTQLLAGELPKYPILKRCARKGTKVIESALNDVHDRVNKVNGRVLAQVPHGKNAMGK